MAKPSCEFCEAESYAKGWCRPHYRRWERYGDPQHVYTPPSLADRFWAKVNKTDTCWLWTGSTTKQGYGHVAVERKTQLAHRVAYQLAKGAIPDGLALDHLCRVRNCVNPDHLDPVTPRENTRRGFPGAYLKARTHCPKGHIYDDMNTRHDARGQRVCKACQRAHSAAWRERNPEKVRELQEAHNARRIAKARANPAPVKSHCPKGHPYDTENTKIRYDGRRQCRECSRVSQAKYNAKRRARSS